MSCGLGGWGGGVDCGVMGPRSTDAVIQCTAGVHIGQLSARSIAVLSRRYSLSFRPPKEPPTQKNQGAHIRQLSGGGVAVTRGAQLSSSAAGASEV